MDLVDGIVKRVSSTCALLAAACGAGVMILMSLDVFNRLFTGQSIRGAFEMVETLMVFLVFLGIAHAERTDAHVRVRLVTGRLPPMAAEITRSFGNAMALGIVVWMAWATTGVAQSSVARGEFRMGLVNFPIWPARIVVAVGLWLLSVELLLTVSKSIRRILHREPAASDLTSAAL